MRSERPIDRGDIENPVDREIAILMDATEIAAWAGDKAGRAYAKAALDGDSASHRRLAREVRKAEDGLLIEAARLFL